eukprot:Rmarinus@m.14114
MRLLCFRSHSLNPFINLAAEESFFRSTDFSKTIVVLFYRNRDSVILGRNQNPWLELDLGALRSRGIDIVRRYSGGGCVFHDSGNLNFSIMCSRNLFKKDWNAGIVSSSLQKHFGVPADVNERNDIVVRGNKVSGSAYRISGERSYHHGTLLLESNLHWLTDVLHPRKSNNLRGRGTESVRSPVTNLAGYHPDLNFSSVSDVIYRELSLGFLEKTEALQFDDMEELSESTLMTLAGVPQYIKELTSWEWVFGETPPFSQTIHILSKRHGQITVYLEFKRAVVAKCHVTCDALDPRVRERLAATMVGKRHCVLEWTRIAENLSLDCPIEEEIHAVLRSFIEEIE